MSGRGSAGRWGIPEVRPRPTGNGFWSHPCALWSGRRHLKSFADSLAWFSRLLDQTSSLWQHKGDIGIAKLITQFATACGRNNNLLPAVASRGKGLGAFGHLVRQELKRQKTIQWGVLGLVHHAYAPAVEFPESCGSTVRINTARAGAARSLGNRSTEFIHQSLPIS